MVATVDDDYIVLRENSSDKEPYKQHGDEYTVAFAGQSIEKLRVFPWKWNENLIFEKCIRTPPRTYNNGWEVMVSRINKWLRCDSDSANWFSVTVLR